jgi:hypothetical protein
MPLKRALPPPTAEQQRRQDLAREHGCIIARRLGLGFVPGEIHHLVDTGRTISQDHTVCLNPWSHRGELWGMWTKQQCLAVFGPSLAKASRAFHAEYGDNVALLRCQNELIGWTQPAQLPARDRRGSTARPSKLLPRVAA